MAEATHRANIKALIESVDDVGIVHDYLRLATELGALLDLFKTTIDDTEVIRGWQITCTAIQQEHLFKTGQFDTGNKRSFPYVIHGYFGVNDADQSEKTAILISEQVLAALTSETLFGAGILSVTPPTLTPFNYQLLGGVLCHHAEIKLTVVEIT